MTILKWIWATTVSFIGLLLFLVGTVLVASCLLMFGALACGGHYGLSAGMLAVGLVGYALVKLSLEMN